MPRSAYSNGSSFSANNNIDDSLGAKLNSLSLEERSEGLHDLHGVSEIEEETPEMLQDKLEELTEALKAYPDLDGDQKPETCTAAYEMALKLSPDYVERLKIMCLRSDRYSVEDAAGRMIRYFSRKLQLFGESLLVKDIQFPDLTVEDMHALQNGLIQLLPQRDRSGRAVMILFGKLSPQYTTETVLRVFFYLSMVALQDEESQKRGFVLVYYGIDQKKHIRGRAMECMKTWNAIPFRIVATHFCSENGALQPIVKLVFHAMESHLLCRFRCHFGTHMECMYNLMTFGIPREVFPIGVGNGDDDNESITIELTAQHELLAALKRREEAEQWKHYNEQQTQDTPAMIDENGYTSASSASTMSRPGSPRCGILIPGPMDLVMGRGRHAKNAPGALRMRHLLDEHRDEYEAASKHEKTLLTEKILSKMKQSGCRFLVKSSDPGHTTSDGNSTTSGGLWVVCEDSIARGRLAHAFRNMRKGGGSGSSAKKGAKRQLEQQGRQ